MSDQELFDFIQEHGRVSDPEYKVIGSPSDWYYMTPDLKFFRYRFHIGQYVRDTSNTEVTRATFMKWFRKSDIYKLWKARNKIPKNSWKGGWT